MPFSPLLHLLLSHSIREEQIVLEPPVLELRDHPGGAGSLVLALV